MSDAIVIQRLTKHYGTRRVVDVVNLRVPTGCVYGFLGRNGAGKSTLIKMLLGMVHADAGHATLLGEDITQLQPATRARIAYLAEGHPLYRWMSVGEAIRFTRRFYNVWHEQFLYSILDHFRIPPKQKIGRLSNGQRAQVSLALALAPDPELLILDDPTLGLDTVVRRDFLESMIHLIQRQGRTIFFSSHILGDVERVADRIGIVMDGVMRVDCPTDHFKSSLRRVSMEFTGSVPELPPLAGLVSQRQYGGRLELTIVGYGDGQSAIVESVGAASVEVSEMNLEDAFVAYTRDPAPPLPVFDREVVAC
jgi:ABC-2 type transport system ATP-binding protein